MSSLKEIVQRESCFQPGSSLCTGCMESVAFQNVGKITDNGKKTIYTLGTFCGEVSTLAYPNIVAWGRGESTPEDFGKSFSIIHNVFESAPTVAEAVSDVGMLLNEVGALEQPIQVISNSGDGGAIAIGLRTLLHTINRRANITIMVIVNEFFANTGFQYSPTATVGGETSTTPVGADGRANTHEPMDYIHLCIAAGAGLVAQVSPAYPKYFLKVMEKALECKETSVIFVPGPCITGWKFAEGMVKDLAVLGAETGFFPCFLKEKGKKGEVKFIKRELEKRTPIEDFMGPQRRYYHLVKLDKQSGKYVTKPGAEEIMTEIRNSIQNRLDRLFKIAEIDI